MVSGADDPKAQRVIQDTCDRIGSRLIEVGHDFGHQYEPPRAIDVSESNGRIDFWCRSDDSRQEWNDIPLGLLGHHQAANAAVALATLTEMQRAGWSIDPEATRRALAKITWPARVELIARRPAVIVDAAHNGASIEATLRVLDESFAAKRRFLIFATTLEKDISGMLQRLLGKFDRIVFTRYQDNPRAAPPEELDALAEEISAQGGEFHEQPFDLAQTDRIPALVDGIIHRIGRVDVL